YSSTTLNGAMVPSPDLSRNVLPLDIFPASIVESLVVQKAPSADRPAAFGGGSVDIRTTGIPSAFIMSLELGTGSNSVAGDFMTYEGGGDDRWGTDDGARALPGSISEGLDHYQGNFTAGNINRIDDLDSITEAQSINRDLIVELNRDISVQNKSGD